MTFIKTECASDYMHSWMYVEQFDGTPYMFLSPALKRTLFRGNTPNTFLNSLDFVHLLSLSLFISE